MFPQKKSLKNRPLSNTTKNTLRSPKTTTLGFPMAWRWRTNASERALSFPFASASFAPAHEQPLPILQTYRTAHRAAHYKPWLQRQRPLHVTPQRILYGYSLRCHKTGLAALPEVLPKVPARSSPKDSTKIPLSVVPLTRNAAVPIRANSPQQTKFIVPATLRRPQKITRKGTFGNRRRPHDRQHVPSNFAQG